MINTLILEVTRRCNMKCAHCLRGAAQAVDMSYETIDATFAKLKDQSIRHLLFTGGEPALGHEAIRMVADAIERHDVSVDGWWVITNGKAKGELQRKFVQALNAVHDVCQDNDNVSGLEISNDNYHDYISDGRRENLIEQVNEFGWANNRLDASYFPTAKIRDKRDYYKLVPDGRAAKFSDSMLFGRWDQNYGMVEEEGDGYVDLTDVYINALGDVIPDCNFSFAYQKKVKLCSVYDEDFGSDRLIEVAKAWDVKLQKLKALEETNV